MTFVFAGILVLLAAGVLVFLLKPRHRSHDVPHPASPTSTRPGPASALPANTPLPVPIAAEPLPQVLTDFVWLGADAIPDAQRLQLLERLRQIPRPSQSLHKLVSPEFINNASSIELGELVLGEPHIAAKVLATVNSPLYGLQRPVVSIGQGVTFLGLNTVRSICLRYMLTDSFKPTQPEVKRLFDTLWGASALASELCSKLAKKLELADPGAMVTQVVLSFLGHLAALSLLPADQALTSSGHNLLERLRDQQNQLGLGAPEIGRLLLQEWALPQSIVDDVSAIDRVLVTPAAANDSLREIRLAVCYLCVRVGEKMAFGALTDLTTYNPANDTSLDVLSLHSHLQTPRLNRLVEMLNAPDLASSVNQMAAGLRKPA